ncbi:MAG: PLP-dependent aminotransferase family protein [Vallitaleaceae bacterium]|jgi:2-aminoadipate transaminase|nr:PLP-dependent aminotransferase family protein [Vallitaleaceae bacterium]
MMILSSRMERLQNTELLMLMELASSKDIISFAGGFPSPDAFPAKEMALATQEVFKHSSKEALQYASTSGFEPLRQLIADRTNKKQNMTLNLEEILITSGSQQSLDMFGKLLLDEGDIVLCESPSYIGAINAFNAYQPEFIEVTTAEDGINIESLKNILSLKGKDIRMIYVIPDFQNPTGRVWSLEKRKAFMAVMSAYEIPIIEDMAYYDLAYEELDRPTLSSLDKKGQVVSLGTFSKIFCPGLRIGWIQASRLILDQIRLLKPNMDLSSSSIAQRQIYQYMMMYDLEAHIEKVNGIYKRRRDLMLDIIEGEFPKGIQYMKPKGGLFTWVEMPRGKDAKVLLELALKEKVAFVPGNSFFPKSNVPESMRINFSCMDDSKLEKGGKILGAIMHRFLEG